MKIKTILSTALLLSSLRAVQAQTALADWTFDNAGITAPVNNPVASSGVYSATAHAQSVGLTNSLTTPASVGAPDVIANPAANSDSTPLLPDAWRVRAAGASPNTGNGWDNAAAVGTQGAQFAVSTVGYQNVQLTFDISATKAGEGLAQVEYTTDGVLWSNAVLTYAVNPSLVLSNSTVYTGTNGLVIGSYFTMIETATYSQVWYTNVTANLSGIPAANNNPNFAVRIVNAAQGSNCVAAANTVLNNTSGNWSLDNVAISGSALPTAITVWDFDTYAQNVMTNSPVPSFGAGVATPLGMNNSYNNANSLPTCDIVATAGASTGSGAAAWRVRGGGGTFATAGTPNGWSSQAPLGTQGAEFDASMAGYTNITMSFDLYFTTAAPAQMQLQVTTDGFTWSNVPTLTYASNPAYILTNLPTSGDANTVYGTYFSQTAGQGFYTNLTAVLPAAAANNAAFGVRIVNATTGGDMLAAAGTAYNNSSGNWRFDNVAFYGVPSGVGSSLLTPPPLAVAPNATVDHPFTNTFPDSSAWRAAITNVTVNGQTLLPAVYAVSAGQIAFTPSLNALLRTTGTKTIVVYATNYAPDTVSQVILPGVATQLSITAQPVAPTGNGGTLVAQPVVAIQDQYGNLATNVTGSFTASVGAGAWSFGAGSGTNIVITNGTASFTNLSAVSSSAVSGATITLTGSGTGLGSLPSLATNSATFNIPGLSTAFTAGNLAVEQEDLVTKNSTFSILEVKPTVANQSAPVNTFPVPATQTNGLRQSSSGSTGRLADSDDGTLLCFSAGLCSDATVSDVTTVDPRGAGTFNYLGQYVLQTTYIGLGDATANQARSAITVDNTNYYIGDKGGVYANGDTGGNAYIPYSVSNPANVRSLKSFGGTVYAMQQEGGTDPTSTVLQFLPMPANAPVSSIPGTPANGSQSLFALEGFPIDGTVLDFYVLRSGNNGNIYDYAYYIDGTNTTAGSIWKFYYTGVIDGNSGQQVWASAGPSWPTPNGGDGLCARTNSAGGVDLFYTTGSGGSPGNSVVMVHDSSAWNQPINLTATNLLYTVGSQATLKGIAFAPQPPAGTVLPITPFNITPGSLHYTVGSGSTASSLQFSFTNAAGISSSFSIWAATNLVNPTWVNLGHPTETSAGVYQITDRAATNGAEFYRISQP